MIQKTPEISEIRSLSLYVQAPTHAEMSEEAYVDMRLQWSQDKHRVRADRSGRRMGDPHIPFSSYTVTTQDVMELNRREQEAEESSSITAEQPEEILVDSPIEKMEANQGDTTAPGESLTPVHPSEKKRSLTPYAVSGGVAVIGIVVLLVAWVRYLRQ